MSTNYEVIELILPLKAEYVSIARLTSSGIANRIGFDIEVVEDIKVSISEVCNKIIGLENSNSLCYKIIFKISSKNLNIIFDCEDKGLKCKLFEEKDELGFSILTALMDDVEFCTDKSYLLSMSKSLEGNV